MNNITIGYLSWKRHDIFLQTLNSHKRNGLFDIIQPENRVCFFQEISNKDIELANKFNCKYIGDNTNIGILNAFVKLIEICKTEYFIFCENDWNLIEDTEKTYKILEDCINILNTQTADVIKLRNRKNPGLPLYSMPTNVSEWLSGNYAGFPYKLESLSWIDDPNKVYNNLLYEYNRNYKWFITTLDHQSWSNNIFICKTEYLKNIILPILKLYIVDGLNNYTGLEDILIKYKSHTTNSSINEIIIPYSKTKLCGGDGLFSHKDKII